VGISGRKTTVGGVTTEVKKCDFVWFNPFKVESGISDKEGL
jgi:hypothetical protein